MDVFITHMTGLLGVAMVVAMLARRLRLPYTVGLVVTGIGLAATRLAKVSPILVSSGTPAQSASLPVVCEL